MGAVKIKVEIIRNDLIIRQIKVFLPTLRTKLPFMTVVITQSNLTK